MRLGQILLVLIKKKKACNALHYAYDGKIRCLIEAFGGKLFNLKNPRLTKTEERKGGGGVGPYLPNFSVVNAGHSSAEGASILGGLGSMLRWKSLKNEHSKRLFPVWSKIE